MVIIKSNKIIKDNFIALLALEEDPKYFPSQNKEDYGHVKMYLMLLYLVIENIQDLIVEQG